MPAFEFKPEPDMAALWRHLPYSERLRLMGLRARIVLKRMP